MSAIKKQILLAAWLICAGASVQAQEAKPSSKQNPSWVSEMGYWVVESYSPKQHLVLFYTPQNVLVYSEHLSNTKLNFKKTAVKLKLKKALETAIASNNSTQNKELVALTLKEKND